MKLWTYEEALEEVQSAIDMQDEDFITPNEMIGYFNEALKDAASEMQAMNKDYFLTKYPLPLVSGTKTYALPENMMANKIRAMMYTLGAKMYEIPQVRRTGKFQIIEQMDAYGSGNIYSYFLRNDVPGQAKIEFTPNIQETITWPNSSIEVQYIRNPVRVPKIGEFCNPELNYSTNVNIGTDVITVYAGNTNTGIYHQGVLGAYPGSVMYITGDKIRFRVMPGGVLPTGLTAYTEYFAIATGSNTIKIATTRQNALSGTAIDLTGAGSGYFLIEVAATETIIDECILDIPEFTSYVIQWVKCRCLEKDSSPRLEVAQDYLDRLKKQMIDTLTDDIQDDDTEIEGDYSAYSDLS